MTNHFKNNSAPIDSHNNLGRTTHVVTNLRSYFIPVIPDHKNKDLNGN